MRDINLYYCINGSVVLNVFYGSFLLSKVGIFFEKNVNKLGIILMSGKFKEVSLKTRVILHVLV